MRNAVVQDPEIWLIEIGDELVAAVQDGEENIDEIDLSDDRLAGLERLLARRRSGLLRLWGLLRLRGLLGALASGTEKQRGPEQERNEYASHGGEIRL